MFCPQSHRSFAIKNTNFSFSAKECDVLHGECVQTYVPYLFLVIPLGNIFSCHHNYANQSSIKMSCFRSRDADWSRLCPSGERVHLQTKIFSTRIGTEPGLYYSKFLKCDEIIYFRLFNHHNLCQRLHNNASLPLFFGPLSTDLGSLGFWEKLVQLLNQKCLKKHDN